MNTLTRISNTTRDIRTHLHEASEEDFRLSPNTSEIKTNPDSPQAFLKAVNFLAFTIPLTLPDTSSSTTVVAGKPSPPSVGILTIFTAIFFGIREGMKRDVMEGDWRVMRGGDWISAMVCVWVWDEEEEGWVGAEKPRKTLAWDSRACVGSRVERRTSMSEEVRMRREFGEEGVGVGVGSEGGLVTMVLERF